VKSNTNDYEHRGDRDNDPDKKSIQALKLQPHELKLLYTKGIYEFLMGLLYLF
jgi:hypothetical protein